MDTFRGGRLVSAILCTVLLIVACGAPAAPRIRVEDVWSRPAMMTGEADETGASGSEMAMDGTGAVFMTLANEGGEADRLVGAKTDVAKVVEIHETSMEGDVMKMQMLPDGIEIPARGHVQLKPGSYHVMLIGLQRNLDVDDEFTIELLFEKSGSLVVESVVRQP